jgi:SpoVK/Ycf46/Vps4 family AAA+-type ATPase
LAIVSDCCRREEVSASIACKVAAVSQLAKRRDAERSFGNARSANNLISDAIKRMNSRIKLEKDDKTNANKGAIKECLTIADIEGEKSDFEKDPMKVLEDLQGDENEGWKKMLLDASDQIYVKKAEGKPLRGIVKNMIFVGPPGTGKTSVARKVREERRRRSY